LPAAAAATFSMAAAAFIFFAFHYYTDFHCYAADTFRGDADIFAFRSIDITAIAFATPPPLLLYCRVSPCHFLSFFHYYFFRHFAEFADFTPFSPCLAIASHITPPFFTVAAFDFAFRHFLHYSPLRHFAAPATASILPCRRFSFRYCH
jgi:hypothetical protein